MKAAQVGSDLDTNVVSETRLLRVRNTKVVSCQKHVCRFEVAVGMQPEPKNEGCSHLEATSSVVHKAAYPHGFARLTAILAQSFGAERFLLTLNGRATTSERTGPTSEFQRTRWFVHISVITAPNKTRPFRVFSCFLNIFSGSFHHMTDSTATLEHTGT